MDITAPTNQASSPVYGGMKKAEAVREVAPKAVNASNDPVAIKQQVKDLSGAEKERFETVLEGSKMFQNFYAVSDSKFTIFKDSSGQFITRFTKLNDSTVTYLPEPDIVRFMESKSDRRAAMFEIEA